MGLTAKKVSNIEQTEMMTCLSVQWQRKIPNTLIMDSSTNILFVLGGKVPNNCDAAIAIYNVAQGQKLKRM